MMKIEQCSCCNTAEEIFKTHFETMYNKIVKSNEQVILQSNNTVNKSTSNLLSVLQYTTSLQLEYKDKTISIPNYDVIMSSPISTTSTVNSNRVSEVLLDGMCSEEEDDQVEEEEEIASQSINLKFIAPEQNVSHCEIIQERTEPEITLDMKSVLDMLTFPSLSEAFSQVAPTNDHVQSLAYSQIDIEAGGFDDQEDGTVHNNLATPVVSIANAKISPIAFSNTTLSCQDDEDDTQITTRSAGIRSRKSDSVLSIQFEPSQQQQQFSTPFKTPLTSPKLAAMQGSGPEKISSALHSRLSFKQRLPTIQPEKNDLNDSWGSVQYISSPDAQQPFDEKENLSGSWPERNTFKSANNKKRRRQEHTQKNEKAKKPKKNPLVMLRSEDLESTK
jgi:hypothetical protein